MNNFQYFGLFLSKDTRNMLLSLIRTEISSSIIDDAEKIFLDHCTLLHKSQLHGNSELYSYLESQVGEQITIKLTALGMSEKAFAFKVALPIFGICANKTPHITIATYRGGKPVDSNSITEWETIIPIEIPVKFEKR